MPGICGIVNRRPEEADAELFAAMLEAMRHQADDVAQSFTPSEPAALGAVHLPFTADRQKAIETSERIAVFSGEIYNVQELKDVLKSRRIAVGSEAGVWEIFLAGVTEIGRGFLEQVDGKFCAAIWDRRDQKLLLITDKFGLKPIYYAETSARLLFGSEIKTILFDGDVSRNQNVRGLAQFFSLGHFWNQDTFYESIRVIPAASVAEYDLKSGNLDFECYWRMTPHSDLGGLSEAEWIERIDARLKASVDAQTLATDHLGIALSGGLDARTRPQIAEEPIVERAPRLGVRIGGARQCHARRHQPACGESRLDPLQLREATRQ